MADLDGWGRTGEASDSAGMDKLERHQTGLDVDELERHQTGLDVDKSDKGQRELDVDDASKRAELEGQVRETSGAG